MPKPLENIGAYRGTITEAGFSATKNGYPQFVARFQATERYVDDKVWMEHFSLDEPGWVDWTEFDEDIVGYLILFNNPDEFSAETAMSNWEQLQIAVGWPGNEFDSLNDDSYVGKKVLFRVSENDWNGKVSLQVEWIDDVDAPPMRQLRKIDSDGMKELSAKLKVQKKKARPTVASSKTATPPKATAKTTPKKRVKPAEELTPPPAATISPEDVALPTEVSLGKAWEYVTTHKGGKSDAEVEAAWVAARKEISGVTPDADVTPTQWASIRDAVIVSLNPIQ